MPIQYVTDANGEHTAVLIPIIEWKLITSKHRDLKNLEATAEKSKTKVSNLAGKLSYETGEAMLSYVAEDREKWEERMKK